jgi:predicted small secreted protein
MKDKPLKRTATLIFILLAAVAISLILAGCGSGRDGAKRLQDSGKAVEDYINSGGYIKFSQELQYGLASADGGLDQKITMQGTAILPERQNYEYQETIKSSKSSEEAKTNAFTYLTLDGGKTAFVKGDILSSQLGVIGWVHYTPPTGQNRYFNFPELMSRLTTPQGEVEVLGSEEISNTTCLHLAYDLNGQDLLNLQLQENPSLQEQYAGVDLSQVVGDMRLEMWIGEEDNLPRRGLLDQSLSENGLTSTTHLRLELSGYGETPLVPIEQPAFFSEAQ